MAKITYYNFMSHSSLSFKMLHKGRYQIIRFSQPYSGASRFMTTDKELADKIKEHRWFRKGLITLQEETIDESAKVHAERRQASAPSPKPTYNINKMKMGGTIPTQAHKSVVDMVKEELPAEGATTTEETVHPASTGQIPEETEMQMENGADELTIESVESFLEAREYLAQVHNIDKNLIRSNDQLAQVVSQLGIEFPNFPLN